MRTARLSPFSSVSLPALPGITVGLLAGAASPEAQAWQRNCPSAFHAELVSVRKVEGPGDPDAEQPWTEHACIEFAGSSIRLNLENDAVFELKAN